MRRILLSVSFLTLLAALWGLWQFRFERAAESPTWRLADIQKSALQVPGISWISSDRQPAMLVAVDAENPRVAARFELPGAPVAKMLHLKFRLTGHRLMQGRERWEDGRFMVEWHSPKAGEMWRKDLVGSIRDDERGDVEELAIEANGEPAIPALRIENLGSSGAFELSNLEITVIHERAIWRVGKWLLALAWCMWGYFMIRSWPGIHRVRALAASAIFLMMGIHFAVPGPWKLQRPMGERFQLGVENTSLAVESAKSPLSAMVLGAIPPEGKLPSQGSFPLRVKMAFAQARPLLHVLLFFGPSLVLSCLVSRRPTLWLMAIIVSAIELAEVAFGYGFDSWDIMDIAFDALGIWLAMWCHAKVTKHFGFLGNFR